MCRCAIHRIKPTLLSFQDDELAAGKLSNADAVPVLRVDPNRKCAVLLAYDYHLAVMPLRQKDSLFGGDPKDRDDASIMREAYWIDLRSQLWCNVACASFCMYSSSMAAYRTLGVENIADIIFLEVKYTTIVDAWIALVTCITSPLLCRVSSLIQHS